WGEDEWEGGRVGGGVDGVAQRGDRLGRPAGFQQRLSLELVEVGILRLRLDERVDLRLRGARVEVAIGRDGARVAPGKRSVAERIAACERIRALQATVKLVTATVGR